MRRRYYNKLYKLTVNAPSSSVFNIKGRSYQLGSSTSIVIPIKEGEYNWTLTKSGYVTEKGVVNIVNDMKLDIVMYAAVTPSRQAFTSYTSSKILDVGSKYISILMFGGGGGGATTFGKGRGPGGGAGGGVLYKPNILLENKKLNITFDPGTGGASGENSSTDYGYDGGKGKDSFLSISIYDDGGDAKKYSYTALGGAGGVRNDAGGNGGSGFGAGGGGGKAWSNGRAYGGGGSGSSGAGQDGSESSPGKGGLGGDGSFGYNGGAGSNGANNGGIGSKYPYVIPLSSVFGGTGAGGDGRYEGGGGGGGYGNGGSGTVGTAVPGPPPGYAGGGGSAQGNSQRGGYGILVIYFHNDPI